MTYCIGGTILTFFLFFFALVTTGLKFDEVLATLRSREACDGDSAPLKLPSVSLSREKSGISMKSLRSLSSSHLKFD